MNGRRAVGGLCLLCALVFSAFAAQGAAAATNGTTTFTCRSDGVGVKDFKTEHCVPGESGTAFGHAEVPENTVTHFTASNEKTDATTSGSTRMTMKTTIAGAAVHIDATGMHATGTLENMKAGSGEHTASAVVSTFKLTGVTETLHSCVVTGLPGGPGTIEFKELVATTAGQEMGIKFSALAGPAAVLAEFELTGCPPISPLTIKVFGSFKCIPSGATIVCNHEEITASKTLRIQSTSGPIVGFEGKTTVTGSHNVLVEPTKPLSFTTKAT